MWIWMYAEEEIFDYMLMVMDYNNLKKSLNCIWLKVM
jgi:hypothetical protein